MQINVNTLLLIIDTLENSSRIANGDGRIFSYKTEDRLKVAEALRYELSKVNFEIEAKRDEE